jgi:hypothetical protein
MGRLSKRKRLLFIAVAFSLGLIVPLCLLEASLHLLWRAPHLPSPSGLLKNDPYTYIACVEDFDGILNTPQGRFEYRTNSQGLRDVDRYIKKEPGTFRLLVIGDSYVEGHGVAFDETFLRKAELRISDETKGKMPVEVIKAGVGGWGPVNEVNFLLHYGVQYKPDAVMVAFFTGNDYWDVLCPDQYVAYRGIRLERHIYENMSAFTNLKITLRKNIFVYGYIVDILKSLRMSEKNLYSEDLRILTFDAESMAPSLTALRETLGRFRQWSVENDTPIHFLILPHRVQLESSRSAEVLEKCGIKGLQVDPDEPSRIIRRLLDEQNIPFLDATSFLREKANEGFPIGMNGDSHYNPKIHSFLADRLADYIKADILSSEEQDERSAR